MERVVFLAEVGGGGVERAGKEGRCVEEARGGEFERAEGGGREEDADEACVGVYAQKDLRAWVPVLHKYDDIIILRIKTL